MKDLQTVETGLGQVKSMVQMIEAQPEKFPHINVQELEARRAFLQETQSGVRKISSDVRGKATRNKIAGWFRRAWIAL